MKINIKNKLGFTLVEVMIVIVILGILATLVGFAYRGVQRRAADTGVLSDINNIAESFGIQQARGNDITGLPDDVKLTKETNVAFIQTSDSEILEEPQNVPKYTNLTPAQNGLLFYTVGCLELYEEERPDAPGLKYGQGRDVDGNVVNYIWGPNMCNVYNHPTIQFNSSWGDAGGIFNVPISQQDFLDHIDDINLNNSHFPDFNHVVKQFYQTMHDRFLVQGGTFPVEVFWDPWCNAAGLSWCKFKEPLPPVDPSVGGGGEEGEVIENIIPGQYCVQASHNKYQDIAYYLMPGDEKPKQGICPEF